MSPSALTASIVLCIFATTLFVIPTIFPTISSHILCSFVPSLVCRGRYWIKAGAHGKPGSSRSGSLPSSVHEDDDHDGETLTTVDADEIQFSTGNS